MASPAPQAPCGCRIEQVAETEGAWTTWRPRIVYCPTHAAAFRLADELAAALRREADPPPTSGIAVALREQRRDYARALLREIGRP